MSVYRPVVEALAADPQLALLFGATSPGDRSVVYQLLDTEDSAGVTSAGSPNHLLWQCFERHGWMVVAEARIGQDLPVRTYEARLTENGRRCLPVALAHLTGSVA
jgi:hypothetical protein